MHERKPALVRHKWNNEEWTRRLEVRDVIKLQAMGKRKKMAELERGRGKTKKKQGRRGRRTRNVNVTIDQRQALRWGRGTSSPRLCTEVEIERHRT